MEDFWVDSEEEGTLGTLMFRVILMVLVFGAVVYKLVLEYC